MENETIVRVFFLDESKESKSTAHSTLEQGEGQSGFSGEAEAAGPGNKHKLSPTSRPREPPRAS